MCYQYLYVMLLKIDCFCNSQLRFLENNLNRCHDASKTSDVDLKMAQHDFHSFNFRHLNNEMTLFD